MDSDPGNFFRKHREALNLSQWDLSKIIDVSPGTISSWERGQSVPRPALVPSLAKALKVSEAQVSKAIVDLSRPPEPAVK